RSVRKAGPASCASSSRAQPRPSTGERMMQAIPWLASARLQSMAWRSDRVLTRTLEAGCAAGPEGTGAVVELASKRGQLSARMSVWQTAECTEDFAAGCHRIGGRTQRGGH